MSAFKNYFVNVIKNKYADFSGRARRSEYWYFALFNIIISILMAIVGVLVGYLMGEDTGAIVTLGLMTVYSLALLIPSLALVIRRLHDSGKSGWMALLGFVPVVGGIILLVFLLLESEPNTNKWGPNPKAVGNFSEHLVSN